MKLRVLFAGSPDIALPSLRVTAARHKVVGVLTNPDRPAGRGRKTVFSPVKTLALELGLPVFQPERLDSSFRTTLTALEPDILVVVAYGVIFGPKFLECFPRGGVNLHPSLLPKYRGPAPVNAAILNGDPETGITIQRIAREVDSGDIILQERVPLTGRETAASLTALTAERGAVLLSDALDLIVRDAAVYTPQDAGGATYCLRIEKEDGRIDWRRPAVEIERMVRAYSPWPSAWTLYKGETLRILAAGAISGGEATAATPPGKISGVDKGIGILVQTGEGLLVVRELQLQSKKAMDFVSFLNGVRDFSGSVLGE
jgi:methionyl-tRNA formyltransferase